MQGDMKVLFVNLSDINVDDEKKILEQTGYLVEICDSVESGKLFLQEEKFNIVLLILKENESIEMQNIDFVQTIRQKDAFVQTLVLAQKSSLSLAVQALESGANEFLLWPVKEEVFLEAINACAKKISRWQKALRFSMEQ